MTTILIALGAVLVLGLIKRLFIRKGRGISLLVPFHCPDPENQRAKNWHWLRKYWECHLPGAEIVIGQDRAALEDPSIPFSKSAAVNDAASKAKGDIFVILDADGYIPADVVLHCAKKNPASSEEASPPVVCPLPGVLPARLIELQPRVPWSDPCHPYRFPSPPRSLRHSGHVGSQHGHWYGAGIQIMPREAFEEVGWWDERFRGWGGEDHAAMRAMDTLYWRHKTMPGQFLHIWHPMIGPGGHSLVGGLEGAHVGEPDGPGCQ